MDVSRFNHLGKRLAALANRRTVLQGIVPVAAAATGLTALDQTAEAGKNSCLNRCTRRRKQINLEACRRRCRRRTR